MNRTLCALGAAALLAAALPAALPAAAPDRAALAARILDNAGMPAFPSAPLSRLSMDGREWTARALELVNGAKDYVLVCSFLTTEHPNAELLLQAMAAARARGVKVLFLVDSASYFRTYPMSAEPVRAAIYRARELGIPVAEYNPIRGRRVVTFLRLLDRDHRKFWVVDGELAVVGGQNVDYDSLRSPSEAGCIDAMAEITSPGAVAELRDSFLASWNAYSVERVRAEDFPVRAEGAEPGCEVRVLDQGPPGVGPRLGGTVTAMIDAFFEKAERELWLVQCYAFVTPALLGRVREAASRGVAVKFVLSTGHIAPRFSYGSYYGIADLLKAGAEVYLFETPEKNLLHYKLMIADGELASIGSANFNFRSQVLSREVAAVFSDPASLAEIGRRFDELRPFLRRVGPEEAARYRGPGYLFNFLLMQVAG